MLYSTQPLRPSRRSPEAPDQQGQLEQILDPKPGPARCYDDERILRNQARPARRQRDKMPLVAAVENTVLTPVVPLLHDVDRLAQERMERMCNPRRAPHGGCADCS